MESAVGRVKYLPAGYDSGDEAERRLMENVGSCSSSCSVGPTPIDLSTMQVKGELVLGDEFGIRVNIKNACTDATGGQIPAKIRKGSSLVIEFLEERCFDWHEGDCYDMREIPMLPEMLRGSGPTSWTPHQDAPNTELLGTSTNATIVFREELDLGEGARVYLGHFAREIILSDMQIKVKAQLESGALQVVAAGCGKLVGSAAGSSSIAVAATTTTTVTSSTTTSLTRTTTTRTSSTTTATSTTMTSTTTTSTTTTTCLELCCEAPGDAYINASFFPDPNDCPLWWRGSTSGMGDIGNATVFRWEEPDDLDTDNGGPARRKSSVTEASDEDDMNLCNRAGPLWPLVCFGVVLGFEVLAMRPVAFLGGCD